LPLSLSLFLVLELTWTLQVSQLVQSALDGYHTCIFTYGQTGSGKTYTMEGPDDPTPETQGVIPRSVQQIFMTAKKLEEQGWQFEMEASFLEIYNETIRDLLCPHGTEKEHEIIHDKKGNTTVTNLTIVKVPSHSHSHFSLSLSLFWTVRYR
jgi:kinesin family protein C1